MRPDYVPPFLPFSGWRRWGGKHRKWPSPGQVIGRLVWALVFTAALADLTLQIDHVPVLGFILVAGGVLSLLELLVYGPRALRAARKARAVDRSKRH